MLLSTSASAVGLHGRWLHLLRQLRSPTSFTMPKANPKVMVLGPPESGKSALVRRYVRARGACVALALPTLQPLHHRLCSHTFDAVYVQTLGAELAVMNVGTLGG